MGQITSLFVRKVVAQVDPSVDHAALLRSVAIDPAGPADPSHMIDDGDYYSLLERIAAVEPDAVTLPLRVGASMRCDEYGAFGLAWKAATNLRHSFERAERYARVLTSVSTYTVEEADGCAFMHLHRDGHRRLGLRLSNEATLASILSISKQVSTEPVRLLGVYVKHGAPESIDEHERYFGCPVHFDTDRDALLVASSSLEAPNQLGDPGLSRFFDLHLAAEVEAVEGEASSEGEAVPSLYEQACQVVAQGLSDGVPSLSSVAKELGMSGRTLQRRLADQGATFQALVDESRRRLAKHLLRDTQYSLAEVAFLTGFAEQSSFTRAFRRWAGQTPRSYRLGST